MKKGIIFTLSLATTLGVFAPIHDVKAIDFSKNEAKYIKLCSSNVSKSDKTTCEQFNAYLLKKNAALKKEISEAKSDISDTNDDLDSVNKKIKAIDAQISQKEDEINYLLTSITKIEKNIADKEKEMKDRLYAMQTYYNSNSYVEFIFGSADFSDFFSRMTSVGDITSYEKDLIKELTDQKAQLDEQRTTLNDAKAALQAQKNSSTALKDKLVALKASQQSALSSAQSEKNQVSAAQQKIDAALDALISNAPSGSTSGSLVAGNSATGNAVAKAALSKLGARYWWGKAGPTYFDCSGLVNWALKQAGVKDSRTTASGYSRRGTSIKYSQLQAGDVITFSYGSGVSHIGIYIGGGKMVHASGRGSGTVGQYSDQCVKTASIGPGTYWYGVTYNYRRLY